MRDCLYLKMPKQKILLFLLLSFWFAFNTGEVEAFQSYRSISLSLSSPDSSNDNSNRLYFTASSGEGQDGFDGNKLGSLGSSPTIAFVQDFGSGKVLLTQDARALYPDTIQAYELELNDEAVTGTYTLSWGSFVSIPALWELSLTDSGADSTIDMQSQSSYAFSLPASVDTVRFSIKIDPINSVREISGDAGWRLLSIPKTGATSADISDDGIGAQFTSNTDSATIYTYDNSGVYEAVSSSATTLTDGYGLAVYFFNNTQNGSSELPLSLDVTGSEPGTDVSVSLNKLNTAGSVGTGGSGLANSYYTLVGNPFASNYNLNSITVTGGAIQDNIQLWDDSNSTYSQLDRTTPSIVAPWQGFWVEVLNANTATGITFPTSGKTASAASGTFFSKQNPDRVDITFTLSSENSYDEAIKLSFRSYAEFGMDVADASKLVPFDASYATMAFVGEYQGEAILKSVESLPFNLTEEVTLSLQPQFVGVDGKFTFAWKGTESIPSGWEMTLHDYEAGINVDMKTESEYIFNAVSDFASKVNPRSILDGPAVKPMKAKSLSANRFGLTIIPGTSVSNETESQPVRFALEQNYPNPFNPNTTIKYSLEEAGLVSLTIYNIVGQKVAELVNEVKPSGTHSINWNAPTLSSGVYYYRLISGNKVQIRKMTLTK